MSLLELVDGERRHLRRLHLLAGLALAVGVTCVLFALGASVLGSARWMALPRPVPFAIWIAVVAADVAVVRWTARRLERRASRPMVAATIEREQAMRAGALRGVLEVSERGALGRRAADLMRTRLEPVGARLAPVERRAVRRGAAQAAGLATIAAAALAAAVPVFNDGMLAILQPLRAWRGTLLPRIQFTDLPTAVLRGETARLHVQATGRSMVTISRRAPGQAWAAEVVPVDARTGIATLEVGPLRADLTIVATDGRSASDTAIVNVTDRPFVGAVSMRATYPAYLGRPPEGLAVGEPARVPSGSTIEVTGRASTALSAIRLAARADTVSLRVNDRAFSGKFVARTSGRYAWAATGAAGPIVDVPPPLELEVVPDSAPRVELVSPTLDTLVAGDDRVTLRATATDDHGLARVELVRWRQSATGEPGAPESRKLTTAVSTVWDGTPELDLAPLHLQPGDALHVKIVAVDNSPWAQRGESRELLLKIPTMEERRAIARASMDSAVSQARQTAAAEKSLEQRTNDAARDRSGRQTSQDASANGNGAGGKRSMSYEAAEKAKAVAQDQRALADQVQRLQEQAATLERQLQRAGALDSSLARQLREAQQLLRDALTPELLAQMEKLEDATKRLSREQAQTSLRDLQAMQQRLREQLEKSAEMLKRAALEGSMQTLKDEAKDIADRDRALADSARANPGSARAEDARRLAERSQRLEDELEKLQDRLEQDEAEAGASRTEKARQHTAAARDALRQAAGQPKSDADRKADSADARTRRHSADARRQRNSSDARAQRDSASRAAGADSAGKASGAPNRTARDSAAQKQNAQKGNAQKGNAQKGNAQKGNAQKGNAQKGNAQKGNAQKQNAQTRTSQDRNAQTGAGTSRGTSGQQDRTGQSAGRGNQSAGQRSAQSEQNGGDNSALAQGARDAASRMDQASEAMRDARASQVNAWKSELTSTLDRAIQDMLQMARREQQLEQRARASASKPEELRGEQSAIKQGLDEAARKLQEEGQKTTLLSGRSQRSVAEAQQKVAEASKQTSDPRAGRQAAGSLGQAADALNRAAASLARDRERANSATSATGFSEMMQQLQEMAKKQGAINAQAQGLLPGMGKPMSSEMQATSRALAREQRQVAQQLDEIGDAVGGDRAAQLAKEAKQLAEALEGGRLDASTIARQQQLFRRLLDAGRSLEKDERDDTSKRQATAARAGNEFRPENASASGRAALKFREPTWDELRGLTAEERRAILEYFKRINVP